MNKQISAFDEAVVDVTEVMKFENWLRFYFVTGEEGEGVCIAVPQAVSDETKKYHRHLWDILDHYNGACIDYQHSCTEVCAHVGLLYDGNKYPPGVVNKVFDSKELKIEMYLFGLWVQGNEKQFDAADPMPFAEWITAYERWKTSREVQDYLIRLTAVEQQPSPEHPSGQASKQTPGQQTADTVQ